MPSGSHAPAVTSDVAASYRDPCGFVFRASGGVQRCVTNLGREAYDRMMSTGLYREAVSRGWLIPHEEAEVPSEKAGEWHRLLRPRPLTLLSQPYEWCFSQLREAAELTLNLHRLALGHGMALKDATPFNIQFEQGRPVFLDTLSFEVLQPARPWVAYRQFCMSFVAPLVLEAWLDVHGARLLSVWPEGIPLETASRMLPARSWLHFPILFHLHLHAWFSGHAHAERLEQRLDAPSGFTGRKQELLTDSLAAFIKGLKVRKSSHLGQWRDYSAEVSYSPAAAAAKRRTVAAWLDHLRPERVIDWGANTGEYSRLAAERGAKVIAIEADAAAADALWCRGRGVHGERILSLVGDLVSPPPRAGWQGREREPLVLAAHGDVCLALALAHHLVLSRNVPLARLAAFFAEIAPELIIEYIPEADPQALSLTKRRSQPTHPYREKDWETAFAPFFDCRERVALPDSLRILYWYSRKAA